MNEKRKEKLENWDRRERIVLSLTKAKLGYGEQDVGVSVGL